MSKACTIIVPVKQSGGSYFKKGDGQNTDPQSMDHPNGLP